MSSNQTIQMTEREAVLYAAEWGSYMSGGDPGACMYGFSPEIGLRPYSEQHRTNCLAHIENCKANVRDNPDDDCYTPDELDKLDCLARMIREASLTDN